MKAKISSSNKRSLRKQPRLKSSRSPIKPQKKNVRGGKPHKSPKFTLKQKEGRHVDKSMLTTSGIRLGHALALAGVASRRASEELVFAGRVRVNGEIIRQPQHKIDFTRDQIRVDGVKIEGPERKVYFLLNKPEGMLCTSEPGLAKIVTDLFKHLPYRLFTVGRLDQATTGLILVTNDGAFAHKVMHPSFKITKEYLAKVAAEITADHLARMAEGVVIDGTRVKPISVKKMRRGTLKIVVGEGKKHEVRLLLAKVGLEVRALTRIRIGSLHLGHLPEGAYRELSQVEIESLLKNEKRDSSQDSSESL